MKTISCFLAMVAICLNIAVHSFADDDGKKWYKWKDEEKKLTSPAVDPKNLKKFDIICSEKKSSDDDAKNGIKQKFYIIVSNDHHIQGSSRVLLAMPMKKLDEKSSKFQNFSTVSVDIDGKSYIASASYIMPLKKAVINKKVSRLSAEDQAKIRNEIKKILL